MTLGGAAQVAAAHCPKERTFDPQSAAITDPLQCWSSEDFRSAHCLVFLCKSANALFQVLVKELQRLNVLVKSRIEKLIVCLVPCGGGLSNG